MEYKYFALAIVVGVLVISGLGMTVFILNNPGESEIKIGFIGPLSGGPSLWGQGSLNMINLAVNEINAEGGINSKRLVVIPEDGKCQPQPAFNAAQKLINVDGVEFILGGHCSPETATIAPILEENRVFGLAGVSTATGILDDYSYVFRTSPPNLDQGELIAEVALEKYGLNNIIVITAQTVFSKSISNDFITAFEDKGGKILLIEEYSWPDTTDFRTSLIKIKNLNPDAIFVSTMGNEGVQILNQFTELGIDSILTGNTVFIHKKINTESGGILPENSFTVSPFVDSKLGKVSELSDNYRGIYDNDIPYNLYFVGAAYDGVYMLKKALEACGEDSTCVRDYFNNLRDFEGVTATFNFNENGDPVLSNWRELRIVNGEEIFEELN